MTVTDSKPLVSIGMPVYNGERFIRQALDSLLSQDYENFELIISDNASTDNTAEICKRYISDRRVQYVRNKENIGALKNFKKLVDMAHGKYFMWAAADDYWAKDFISTMVEELERHPQAGVVMSGIQLVNVNGETINSIRFLGDKNPNKMNHYQMLIGLTASGKKKEKYNLYIYGLFRTQLLKESIPFLPNTLYADRLFMCHMALATQFRYVDRILYFRTIWNDSIYDRYPEEYVIQLLKNAKYKVLKVVLNLGKILCKSNLIPLRRKIYIPNALWRMFLLMLAVNRREVKDIKRG
jgi:glycosyltransferase involved in cell wall biosynthesis